MTSYRVNLFVDISLSESVEAAVMSAKPKDFCVACEAVAHQPNCPTLKPPADMIYHPNQQCSCVGCEKARVTRTNIGTFVLEKKIGMHSCAAGDQCAMCIALRGVDPPRKAVDRPHGPL